MVVIWKRVSATQHVARWQGNDLSLLYVPGTGWEVHINGFRTSRAGRASWPTVQAAKDTVEGVALRLLGRMGTQAVAQPHSRVDLRTTLIQSGLIRRGGGAHATAYA